ncbi:non-ribosomal peptide synthetase [Micromonospora inyonensis]|uniref:Amino acid adenylation domain-containing protein n=1 Tax=Micromonospora inyonensis TaxID=47866 RepID=A0A1C6SN55_9ACTN|nr:non-ribosomal peptide synthetase [Micromonospora inyonensis]SCL31021.1 amino acid adenylation domain-containing protein [Micromonospora inyonensis]
MTSPVPTVGGVLPPAVAPATSARLPLSFAQEQLWLVDQLSPGESAYNSPLVYRLRGTLDVAALRAALTALVARHDALRATFGTEDGTPYQEIAPPAPARLEVRAVPGDTPDDRETALHRTLRAEVATPFDLQAGPLYRFLLLRVAADDHVLLLLLHHIVTDGWSTGVLRRDLAVGYASAVAGHPPQLPPPGRTYAAHVLAQRARLTPETLAAGLRHWERTLRDVPPVELPTDRPRAAAVGRPGATVVRSLPDALGQQVAALCRDRQVSPFMLLTAGLAAVLATEAGQEDLSLGVPLLGRAEAELEDVVGLFVNMVVLRLDLSGDPTFDDLLDRVAEASLGLYDHDEVPFAKVVERVRPVRTEGRNPLFQVCVQLLGADTTGAGLSLPGLTVELVPPPSERSPFDLSVDFAVTGERIAVHLTYATDLFDRWRIDALLDHLTTLLTTGCADPARPLSRLPLLSARERTALLDCGDGGPFRPDGRPLDARIAAVAAARPEAVAAVCRGRELTYGELLHRADALAHRLVRHGAGPERVVAVVADRDLDLLVAVLGVLRAGAAVTILDPTHPPRRLGRLIDAVDAPVVLARAALVDRLPPLPGRDVLPVDGPAADPPAPGPLPAHTAATLAAVVTTSGSTGRPKPVALDHAGLGYFVDRYRRALDLGPADRMLQFCSLTFDLALGEVLTALTVGATLVLVSPEEGSAPDEVAALMRAHRVTYLGLTPTMLGSLDPTGHPDLRVVMSAGEVLTTDLVDAWRLPGRRMVNLYGPTEVSVACTDHECAPGRGHRPPPIGRPHPGRWLYVVDRYGRLAPRGAPGELLVGGVGLARGYLGQPARTAERFVADPFRPGGRVYRTGDLVRWNAAGELEFLGRLDDQVKLRGLRIEPGEIESALLTHPRVGRAAVVVRPDPRGEPRLVGYVSAEGPPPTPAELRAHLDAVLPAYLVPGAWCVLDEFPLTSSQKIDRVALPDPDPVAAPGGTAPAATPTEAALVAIFGAVLGVPEVGVDANLFALGGSSLQGMRVVGQINRTFGVRLSLRLLYGTATIRDLAARVDGTTREAVR